MRIWFNKTFSTIQAVFNNLRQSTPAGEVTLICTHTHNNASAFLSADESHLEPVDLTGEAYIEWCTEFCREHKIDIFWVGKEAALVSNNHALFEAVGTKVLSVADHDTLTLLHDKARFYTELPAHIAQVMDFVAVNHRDEFDSAIEQLAIKHTQLCVKPAVSVFGLGFRILDTQRDSISQVLKGVEYQIPLQELRQGMLNTPQFDTLLVMEHLSGHEWSVDCAARYGELLCAVQRKKSLYAGHGQLIDNHPDIQDMVERLTAYYRLNGIFNIQFKEGQYGVRLLEINPRPSGGFGMACLSGANLAAMALQAFKGETVEPATIHYQRRITEVNTPVILHD
jgi:carbamoylphosphate synthase large subunit